MARKHELQMSSRLDTCYSNFSEATKGLKYSVSSLEEALKDNGSQ